MHHPAPPGHRTRSGLPAGGLNHTKAGEAFNVQPDGSAALWIRFDRTLADDEAAVDFGGTMLPGNLSGNVVTAAVPASLYAKPGVFMVHVVARKDMQSVRSNDVRFTVEWHGALAWR